MRATQAEPTLASSRGTVTEMVEAEDSFDTIEDAIDAIADLTDDQKAALWLLAFSMRDHHEQLHDARAHLAVVGG